MVLNFAIAEATGHINSFFFISRLFLLGSNLYVVAIINISLLGSKRNNINNPVIENKIFLIIVSHDLVNPNIRSHSQIICWLHFFF